MCDAMFGQCGMMELDVQQTYERVLSARGGRKTKTNAIFGERGGEWQRLADAAGGCMLKKPP